MFPAWELQAQMKYLDTRNQTLISNNFTAPRCIFAELKFVSHSIHIQIGHFASDIEKTGASGILMYKSNFYHHPPKIIHRGHW